MEAQEAFTVNKIPHSKQICPCALCGSYSRVSSCLAVTADAFSLWLSIPAGQEVVPLPITRLLDFSSVRNDLDMLWSDSSLAISMAGNEADHLKSKSEV